MILSYGCFVPGSVSPSQIADLLEREDLGFEPATIRTDLFGRPNGVKYSQESIDRLRGLAEAKWVVSEGEDGEEFSHRRLAGWPLELLTLKTAAAPPAALVEAISRLPGFASFLIGDNDDVFWQSMESTNTYMVFGKSCDHLPQVFDKVRKRDKVDISRNVGRRSPAPTIWLWAASKMVFGSAAFAILDRERLAHSPIGEVTTNDDGLVTIDLFDLTADEVTIRAAQGEFREWMGYDDLEARARELADEFDIDPAYELDTGEFEHGGVRMLTEWLKDGRPAPRSIATQRRQNELTRAGNSIWSETVDI